MCDMDISELNEWFIEAKEHQQRLKEERGG